MGIITDTASEIEKIAARVAKVKNMYYQDLIGGKTPVELSFAPAFSFAPSQSGSTQMSAGLALQVKF